MAAGSINNTLCKRFIELLSVDSTNNYAMQKVHKGASLHGDAYFAFEQTAGKGQLNKKWHSLKGENILLSIVLHTGILQLHQQFLLNMVAALSVMQLFNKYTTETIKIKWPNDIYCRDRKAAGILIENVIRGQKWQFAIAGFGININQTQFDETLKSPVSLKQITGQTYAPITLAKELCILFSENFELVYKNDSQQILRNYNLHLYRLNETVTFKKGHTTFSGLVKEVNEAGNIVIDSGVMHEYQSGQLEWLH